MKDTNKRQGFRMWKSGKQWLFAGAAALTIGLVGLPSAPGLLNAPIAQALTLSHGQVIGDLNGVPLIQSPNNNMSSPEFQSMVDSILAEKDLGNARYVADTISFNSNSKVVAGPGVTHEKLNGQRGIAFAFYKDGYVAGDDLLYVPQGGEFKISNVGTVTDLETGDKIPVNLIVRHVDLLRGADGWSSKGAFYAVKGMNGVITIAAGTRMDGTGSTSGGSTEGGGVGSSGGTISGALGYINMINYQVGLVRADTGEVIPNEQVVMAMKVSDIDASQRAYSSRENALAYILSSNTTLGPDNGGFKTRLNHEISADSTNLEPTSYVVLTNWNSQNVKFEYTDGSHEHFDIVTGLFGNVGFKLNTDTKGVIEITKTGSQSGSQMWNSLYTLEGNTFKLTDKKTGQTYEGTTDAQGKVVFNDLPFGTYTVEETKASPGFKKTFPTQEVTLSKDTPKATINGKEDQLLIVTGTNEEITGEVQIVKTGTQSGTKMWNSLYSLAGNTFTLTHQETGEVYTVTTDESGKAKVTGMKLGEYLVEETKSSPGFHKTFQSQRATLTQDGPLSFEVTGTNDEITGEVQIVKTGTQSGTKMWNSLYTLKGNTFTLTHQETGEVYTVTTDESGKTKVTGMKLGEYLVEETKSSPGFHKTFQSQRATLTQDGTLSFEVTGTNDEITGKVKIIKKGEETGLDLWNERYSLAGNTFRLTNKESNTTYTITTDARGEALVEGMELGDYTVEELTASPGFVRTFKTQSARLRQDGVLEVDVTGTNQEIKGENSLYKVDKETGNTTPQGQAILKNAEYTLYYGDDATGSSPHKKDTPVQWGDHPNAKLLKGEKVKESIVNGQLVDNKDTIVLNVDDKDLTVAVGNLALGKYYWKETNATEGYGIDGAKYEFEITKKDDVTQNIITPSVTSKEQVIKAAIEIHKIAQSKGDGSHAGVNDVTFRATPIDGTKAEPVEFTTTIKDGEDGYASATLVYGDWKIEEVESPEGYSKIDPIYIHMSYDQKTDLYTITASKAEDGSKPFSTRTFSQSDDQSEANSNVKGSLAGVLTSSNTTITLSKMTFKDNYFEEEPDDDDFQPEKYVVSGKKLNVTNENYLDDDREIEGDKYEVTNKDPYVDGVENNEETNWNTLVLSRDDKPVYQVWLDTTKFEAEDTIAELGGRDTLSAYVKPGKAEDVKIYDKWTGKEATSYFDVTIKGQDVEVKVNAKGKKDGIVNTDLVKFGRRYQVDIPVTIREDAPSYTDIENVAEQFVTYVRPDGKKETVTKKTQKRVNQVRPKDPEPHKFTVKDQGFDVKGTSLLDDDSELSDRYEDTIKDPYADKTDNNDSENHNTRPVSAGDLYTYQVWLDTTPYSERSTLQVVGIDDDYDEKLVEIESIVAYDKETGKEATSLFDIEDTDGRITARPTQDVKKAFAIDETTTVDIIDTSKFNFGRYYQFDITVRVKDDVADDVDIVNHAQQVVINHKGEELILPTEKRVNPVTSIVVQPHKFVLNQEGFDVTGTKLLDDDSELSDRYVDTNKDPYVDKTDNNEPENVNTQTVNPRDKLHYQVWMDTTPYNKDSLLQLTGIEDDYDQDKVRIVDVKVRNKKTGKEATDLFKIEDKNGVLVANPKAEVLKDLEGVQVIDTDKFELGAYYQFDITAQVKDVVAPGTDIVNTAKQIIITREGKKLELATEKRVNKTPEKKKGILPNTGEVGNYLLTGAGVVLLGILAFLRKRKDEE
ncbi:TPA: KxYKxGKxW signal peptide domain-containing protein [Streptococcus suis]|uniref:SpaA isopeptide-forming pilin-related protein n=1 Tax=Streptococcus suis TaxID=1307 RepID=UPI00209AEA03|nr:SpaA isopeptide-forming pilin-related protein [Streptococcus suis]MCO8200844.1 SpaA isopeptide-forming pilin-related protein [Streptococcus suis]MCO8218381.1 SpaA isopeptide-forming pilin-related protein [Streptococcus suis]HEM3467931.1 KxYKxGKxW signal peptide domain-containing protein [Streptococcus suis]HEM3478642.1 KxYKxGKxW signal peptide domain-containing protein [Streptococcus suis]